jgi:hypothetical protein
MYNKRYNRSICEENDLVSRSRYIHRSKKLQLQLRNDYGLSNGRLVESTFFSLTIEVERC